MITHLFFFLLFSLLLLVYSYRGYFYNLRKLTHVGLGKSLVVAFFHPHCFAGGGGERVLWKIIQTLGIMRESGMRVNVVVYTLGNSVIDDYHSLKGIRAVGKNFNIEIPHSLPLQLIPIESGCSDTFKKVFLKKRKVSMLSQACISILMAWKALNNFTPDIYFDTTGCAFTFFIAKIFVGCKVVTYVHYPTISKHVISLVWKRKSMHSNRFYISKSVVRAYLKTLYYVSFAFFYGIMGCFADLILVNSSWTYSHILYIWWFSLNKIKILYPPCHTRGLQNLDILNRGNIILSVGQFRPEKNHELQINLFAQLIKDYPSVRAIGTKLVIIGSCRCTNDEQRVIQLKQLAMSQNINEFVKLIVNEPYSAVNRWLGIASVGIHTMWCEHFGIGVVEMMAAGLITVAHDSGGPKLDLIVNGKNGYLAITAKDYADIIYKSLKNGPNCHDNLRIRVAAKNITQRLSDHHFTCSFQSILTYSFQFC